jgi:hypothetical protein
MRNKTKYYLFITSLVFIGLIVAVGLFLAAGFTANAFVFPQRFGDLPFTVQFAILAVIYFLVFPAVMVLIGNLYLKTSGKKTWNNWLKIPLNYNSIITVIAVYQCAFLVIEVLVSFNTAISSSKAFDSIIRVMMFTVPFIMFIFSKKILKKLFGLTEIDGVCETGEEEKIDPNNFTIRQPVYALVIYIVITPMLMGILAVNIWMWIDYDFRLNNLLATLMFLPLGLLGPFLIFLRSRWKIVIKDKQIKYTTYFGRTKSCTFDYITKVTQGIRHTKTGTLNMLTVYHDKKILFAVSHHCSGYNEFFQRLKDEGVKIIE